MSKLDESLGAIGGVGIVLVWLALGILLIFAAIDWLAFKGFEFWATSAIIAAAVVFSRGLGSLALAIMGFLGFWSVWEWPLWLSLAVAFPMIVMVPLIMFGALTVKLFKPS